MGGRDGTRGSDLASLLQSALAKTASGHSSLDPLTGLPNRQLFNMILGSACASSESDGIAVLRLCVDDVSDLRDEQGQAIADALLAAVAGRLRRSIRTGDVAAKLRDADFALVLAADDVAEAACAAQRVLERLREPYEVSGSLVDVTVSIGIAFASPGTVAGTVLLERAEIALERARSSGRGEWKIFKPGNGVDPDTQASMLTDLQSALRHDEMSIALQPVVRLDDLSVVGADAILHWDHPKIGRIASSDFLPVLSDPKAARLLADWSIERVCMAAAVNNLRISLALDASMQPSDHLAERVAAALVASGVDPGLIWIGVPESVFLGLGETGLRALTRIRALGVRVILDDLSYDALALDSLRGLPIDAIRTSNSVIEALETDIHAFAWVQALTGLARSLRILIGAKGIETEHDVERLARFGFGPGPGRPGRQRDDAGRADGVHGQPRAADAAAEGRVLGPWNPTFGRVRGRGPRLVQGRALALPMTGQAASTG